MVAGQTAIVQNAAVGLSSSGFVGGFGYIVPVAKSIRIAVAVFRALPPAQNVVAPGMLAVLYRRRHVAAKISIRPSGSDTPIRVEVISSTSGQTTFVVPRNMPLGGAEVEYQAEGQPTGWTNVNVVAASFDFFRIGPGGPAIAQSVGPGGSLSPIGLTTPAQPGQTILLKGSGLGNARFYGDGGWCARDGDRRRAASRESREPMRSRFRYRQARPMDAMCLLSSLTTALR